MSKFLTVKEVCELSKVSRGTVLGWIRSGQLKAFKLGAGGRLWRIRERELQRFIKGQQRKP